MAINSLKWYESLSTKKGRRETGCFMVEGVRSVEWLVQSYRSQLVELIAEENFSANVGMPVDRWVTSSQFKRFSQMQTPQGVAAVVRIPEQAYSDQLPAGPGEKILFLENVQDPGNVGSCIRCAAAFGFSGIVMTDQCADPFAPKCVQSSAGSLLALWYRRHVNATGMIQNLQQSGYKLVAMDLNGEPLEKATQSLSRIVLALGNEGEGLSQRILSLADIRWTIPMDRSRAESLNVAASGAIGMYEFSNKRTCD